MISGNDIVDRETTAVDKEKGPGKREGGSREKSGGFGGGGRGMR